jgi:hypothetical protein
LYHAALVNESGEFGWLFAMLAISATIGWINFWSAWRPAITFA